MRSIALTRVELDPVVDLIPIRAVVRDCSLDQAERDPEVFGRVPLIAVAAPDDRNRLPDIEPGALEPRATAGWPVNEPDQRMVVCSQPFLDVTLGKRARATLRLRARAPSRSRVASGSRKLSGWAAM